MINSEKKASLVNFAKLARSAQVLFWVLVVYTMIWSCRAIILSSISPMNPVARSSAWGQFKWYLPGYFEFVCLAVPLIFLYFSQSKLIKGCKTDDAGLIHQGLHHLFQFVLAQVICGGLKIVFVLFPL